MRRKISAAVFLAVLSIGCGDVEVKPEESSGEDFEKAGAKELFFDKLTDDHISFDEGDTADWKFIKVKTPGILTITVYWDDREVKSIVNVYDRFATIIDSRRHTKKLEKDKMEIKVEPGTHFIEFITSEGGSVYTVEAKFEPFDWNLRTDNRRPTDVAEVDLIDDPLPSDSGARRRTRRGRTRPRARGRSRTPRRRATGGASVTGMITRMVPGARKKSTVLTIRVGRNSGVQHGDRGQIMGRSGPLKGGGFEIINVRGINATARTNLKKNEIAHRRRVQIFLSQ